MSEKIGSGALDRGRIDLPCNEGIQFFQALVVDLVKDTIPLVVHCHHEGPPVADREYPDRLRHSHLLQPVNPFDLLYGMGMKDSTARCRQKINHFMLLEGLEAFISHAAFPDDRFDSETAH